MSPCVGTRRPETPIERSVMSDTTRVISSIVEEAFDGFPDLDDRWVDVHPPEKGRLRRSHPRHDVTIPVVFKVILESGKIFNRGNATVKEISPSGALMEEFEFTREAFPTSPFKISFKILEGLYEGVEALCEPLRFVFRPRLGIGLRFDMLSVRV